MGRAKLMLFLEKILELGIVKEFGELSLSKDLVAGFCFECICG